MTKQSPRRSFFRRDDAENQAQTPSREASSGQESLTAQSEPKATRAPRATKSEEGAEPKAPRATRATKSEEGAEPKAPRATRATKSEEGAEPKAPRATLAAKSEEGAEPKAPRATRATKSEEGAEPKAPRATRATKSEESAEPKAPRATRAAKSEEGAEPKAPRATRATKSEENAEPKAIDSEERAPRTYEKRESSFSSDERTPKSPRTYEKREPRPYSSDRSTSSDERAPRTYGKRESSFSSDERAPRTYGKRTDEQSQDRKPFGGSFQKYEPRNQRDENSAYNPENRTFKTDRKDAEHKGERPRFSEKKELRPTYSHLAPAEKQSDPTVPVRLNRFIGMSGICSRREADELIIAGEVKVNGEVVDQLGSKVTPATDVIELNGQVLKGEKKVYIVMNKPKGYVTTTEDPHAERTVIDLLKGACKERVYPVGRLDKNTTGVILLTNDGDLTKELTHPSYEKSKLYHVFLDKDATQDDLDQLSKGITLEDGQIKADEISFVEGNPSEVGIEIHSGRNRIVRRMFEHLGYEVLRLDRVHFAGMGKMGLRRGFWRYLTPREVATLKGKSYR